MQDPVGSKRPCLMNFQEEFACRIGGCDGVVSVDWREAELDRYPQAMGGRIILIAMGHCFKCKKSRAIIKGEREAVEKGFLDPDGMKDQIQSRQKFATA